MKRGPNKPRIVRHEISKDQDRIIREQCRPILEDWGRRSFPAMDINELVRSCYVPGLMDGMQCAERAFNRSLDDVTLSVTESP